MVWLGEDDTRTPVERYVIMFGVVETPIIVALKLAPGQQSVPANPHEIGWIDVATTELTDIAQYLRRTVIRSQARVEYNREWQ